MGIIPPEVQAGEHLTDHFTIVNGHHSSASASFVRHSTNSLDRISPCPVSSTLNTSMIGVFSLFRIRHTPSPRTVILSPNHLSATVSFAPFRRIKRSSTLTIQKNRRKIDTNVAVPTSLSLLLHHLRDPTRSQFLNGFQNPFFTAEPHYDFGHAEKE